MINRAGGLPGQGVDRAGVLPGQGGPMTPPSPGLTSMVDIWSRGGCRPCVRLVESLSYMNVLIEFLSHLDEIITWSWMGSISIGFWWFWCHWKAEFEGFSSTPQSPKSVRYSPRSGAYYDLIEVWILIERHCKREVKKGKKMRHLCGMQKKWKKWAVYAVCKNQPKSTKMQPKSTTSSN